MSPSPWDDGKPACLRCCATVLQHAEPKPRRPLLQCDLPPPCCAPLLLAPPSLLVSLCLPILIWVGLGRLARGRVQARASLGGGLQAGARVSAARVGPPFSSLEALSSGLTVLPFLSLPVLSRYRLPPPTRPARAGGGVAAREPGRRLPCPAAARDSPSHQCWCVLGKRVPVSRAAAGRFDGQDRVLVVSYLRPGCARHVPLRCWPHRPLMLQRPSGMRPAFRGKEGLDRRGAACARWQAIGAIDGDPSLSLGCPAGAVVALGPPTPSPYSAPPPRDLDATETTG